MNTTLEKGDFKLILTIKKFLGKISSYKKKLLTSWKNSLNIVSLIFLDKNIKNFQKNYNLKDGLRKFSLRFFINKRSVKRNLGKNKKDLLFLNGKGPLEYKKQKNLSPETTACAPKKICSSLESYHTTKFNQISLIRKEKRIEIDSLIRKEIIRISCTTVEKRKNIQNSINGKNYKDDVDKNTPSLFCLNKIFNRKLIKNTNQILKLLNEIFI